MRRRPGDSLCAGLCSYFDSRGVFTDWYWPADVRGKLANWLSGNGWRIG